MTDPVRHTTDVHESTGELAAGLSEQISHLVRSELRLAQTEVKEKGKGLGIGAGMFGGSGYFAHLGTATLVVAAVLGLATVVSGWLAALIVAAALLVVAGVLALAGKGQVKRATPPVPDKAVEGVKEDIATVKGQR
jgi:hypothetical protein